MRSRTLQYPYVCLLRQVLRVVTITRHDVEGAEQPFVSGVEEVLEARRKRRGAHLLFPKHGSDLAILRHRA